MSPIKLIAWAALGICVNVGLARFSYGIMLPALRDDLGLDYATGGGLNALHLLGYLVGTLGAPTLARHIGMRSLARYGHVVLCVGALISAATPIAASGPTVLGVGRFLMGLGGGGAVLAILVMAFAGIKPSWRGPVSMLAWGSTGVAIATTGGVLPFLPNPDWAWRGVFLVCAALAAILALGFPPHGRDSAPPAAGAGFNPWHALSPRWVFLNAHYFLFGIAYVAYATFAGTRMAALRTAPGLVAATWVAYGMAAIVGAAITAWALGLPKWRERALMGAGLCGALGSLVASGGTPGLALAGASLVGLGLAATPALVSAFARDRSAADHYPRAFSIATACLGLGQLIGPALAGGLADRFGTVAVPLFAATMYGLGVLVAVADRRVATVTP